MGSVSQIAKMKVIAVVLAGVAYGHGLVSGYGAIGNRALYGLHYGHPYGYYGKREAEAEPEPYTIGQVAAGLPVYNAYATGHPHNVGYTAYVSHGLGYYGYGKREAEAEPYTIAQVAAGLPIANAYATGHPHNVGYTAYVSHGY